VNASNSLDSNRKKLLHEIVLDSIFQALVEGRIVPGQRLVEERIARELNVSRSPVRQALQEMARQGIVVLAPQVGAYVSIWSVQDVEDFGRLRALTEGLAAEQAASRIEEHRLTSIGRAVEALNEAILNDALADIIASDLSFHREVVGGSHNTSLIHAFEAMDLRIRMFLVIQKYLYPSLAGQKEAYVHHDAIYTALLQRDANLAHERMKSHILKATATLVDRMNCISAEKEASQVPLILDTILLNRRPEPMRRTI
jgi:DNA-binding GntR family transcriptional regulator